jgi:hypothetical protein
MAIRFSHQTRYRHHGLYHELQCICKKKNVLGFSFRLFHWFISLLSSIRNDLGQGHRALRVSRKLSVIPSEQKSFIFNKWRQLQYAHEPTLARSENRRVKEHAKAWHEGRTHAQRRRTNVKRRRKLFILFCPRGLKVKTRCCSAFCVVGWLVSSCESWEGVRVRREREHISTRQWSEKTVHWVLITQFMAGTQKSITIISIVNHYIKLWQLVMNVINVQDVVSFSLRKFQFLLHQVTNVTPIIRTHNILTPHNRTHRNPLKHIKKLCYYGFGSQQVTSEKLLWELCWMIFLRLMP